MLFRMLPPETDKSILRIHALCMKIGTDFGNYNRNGPADKSGILAKICACLSTNGPIHAIMAPSMLKREVQHGRTNEKKTNQCRSAGPCASRQRRTTPGDQKTVPKRWFCHLLRDCFCLCSTHVGSAAVCGQLLIHFVGQVTAVEQLVVFRDLFLQVIFGIAGIQQLAQPQHA